MLVRSNFRIQRIAARSFATAANTATRIQLSQPRQPTVVKPTRDQLSLLDERNLERAVRAIHEDGLVVVENVISHDVIDCLNEKMIQDALVLQARGKDGPFNYNQGNLQQDPPPVAEHFHPSIFLNPIATQITSAILGPKPKWTFCSANAAMPPLPGAKPQRQPVHSDADFAHPSHPFALVVNVPLVTMRPENGSTEVWLGTHTGNITQQEGSHGDRASGRIKEELLKKQTERDPPTQPIIPKGSIIVRDLRLWHAGMPNKTDQVRIMLAMIHFASWYRNPMRLEFSDDIKPIIENLDCQGKLEVQVPIEWATRKRALQSYLDRGFGNSYDFNQAL